MTKSEYLAALKEAREIRVHIALNPGISAYELLHQMQVGPHHEEALTILENQKLVRVDKIESKGGNAGEWRYWAEPMGKPA